MFQPRAIILLALSCAAGASQAGVHIECKPARSGPCADMPAPPTPPAPPAPPARPAPPPPPHAHEHAHALAMAPLPPAPPPAPAAPAAPAEPAVPAPPAPPAPPPLPAIPDELHAACANKKPGTRLSWTLSPGETMSGFCERSKGTMVFRMRSYHRK